MKKNHYIDNVKFYECIVDYKKRLKEAIDSDKEPPRIPEFAGKCILLIAENVCKMSKFSGYSYRDEMKSDAIQNCITYFDSFNEEKYQNPHAYFTMICYRANQQRIKDEKKGRYAMYKNFDNHYMLSSNRDLMTDGTKNLISEPIYENINAYIHEFEDKDKKFKLARANKLKEKKQMKDSLSRFYVNKDE